MRRQNRTKIVSVMTALLIALSAFGEQKELSNDEKNYLKRIYQLQESDDTKGFYRASDEYMDYLQKCKDWKTFYNVWMNKASYNINHRRFYRAYTEIRQITNDMQLRGKKEYIYLANRMMGIYYLAKGHYAMSERFLMKALQEVDTIADKVGLFNVRLTLAETLSYTDGNKALECLDRLPSSYKKDMAAHSAVLSYYCIFSCRSGNKVAFRRYYEQYESLRKQNPDLFNMMNYDIVKVYYNITESDYPNALAWCDSIREPVQAAEMRTLVFKQMGEWKKAFYEQTRKDSIEKSQQNDILEEDIHQLTEEIMAMEKEKEMAKDSMRRYINTAILVCLFLLMVLAGSLYYQRQNARKQNLALGSLINKLLDTDARPKETKKVNAKQPEVKSELPVQGEEEELLRLFREIDNRIRDERLYANISFQRQDVLNAFGISRTTLSRLLNTYAGGQSFPAYINTIRLEKACMMLRNEPTKMISVIAKEVGLTEHNIYRLFQQYFGQTPLQYRTNHQKD
ncbi:MAG: helix-turn-helix transcriptional regulator [Prevotella sp.]|nr:helix-turn-helix transcriptional regulator [Prevotella sp.]MBR1401003.1 helix-turn-helix transcriptional regulator [Prevotella sp.]